MEKRLLLLLLLPSHVGTSIQLTRGIFHSVRMCGPDKIKDNMCRERTICYQSQTIVLLLSLTTEMFALGFRYCFEVPQHCVISHILRYTTLFYDKK